MGVQQAFTRCPFILPPLLVAGGCFDRRAPLPTWFNGLLGRLSINRQRDRQPTRATPPQLPPLPTPVHHWRTCTSHRYADTLDTLGQLGSALSSVHPSLSKLAKAPQGTALNRR